MLKECLREKDHDHESKWKFESMQRDEEMDKTMSRMITLYAISRNYPLLVPP